MMKNMAGHTDKILTAIKEEFPEYYVEMEEVVDTSSTLAAAVYGVLPGDIDRVRKFINDLDWELFRTTRFGLMPMVIDRQDTEQYYPEYLRYLQSDAALCLGDLVDIDGLVGLYADMTVEVVEPKHGWPPDVPTAIAADYEMLALAA